MGGEKLLCFGVFDPGPLLPNIILTLLVDNLSENALSVAGSGVIGVLLRHDFANLVNELLFYCIRVFTDLHIRGSQLILGQVEAKPLPNFYQILDDAARTFRIKYIVLVSEENADKLVVIGHHPINWMV